MCGLWYSLWLLYWHLLRYDLTHDWRVGCRCRARLGGSFFCYLFFYEDILFFKFSLCNFLHLLFTCCCALCSHSVVHIHYVSHWEISCMEQVPHYRSGTKVSLTSAPKQYFLVSVAWNINLCLCVYSYITLLSMCTVVSSQTGESHYGCVQTFRQQNTEIYQHVVGCSRFL